MIGDPGDGLAIGLAEAAEQLRTERRSRERATRIKPTTSSFEGFHWGLRHASLAGAPSH